MRLTVGSSASAAAAASSGRGGAMQRSADGRGGRTQSGRRAPVGFYTRLQVSRARAREEGRQPACLGRKTQLRRTLRAKGTVYSLSDRPHTPAAQGARAPGQIADAPCRGRRRAPCPAASAPPPGASSARARRVCRSVRTANISNAVVLVSSPWGDPPWKHQQAFPPLQGREELFLKIMSEGSPSMVIARRAWEIYAHARSSVQPPSGISGLRPRRSPNPA